MQYNSVILNAAHTTLDDHNKLTRNDDIFKYIGSTIKLKLH